MTHLTVRSSEPDMSVLPSELMVRVSTAPVCPRSVLVTSPDARFHTLGRFRR